MVSIARNIQLSILCQYIMLLLLSIIPLLTVHVSNPFLRVDVIVMMIVSIDIVVIRL